MSSAQSILKAKDKKKNRLKTFFFLLGDCIVKKGRQDSLSEVMQANLCIVKSILICVKFAVRACTEGSKQDLLNKESYLDVHLALSPDVA